MYISNKVGGMQAGLLLLIIGGLLSAIRLIFPEDNPIRKALQKEENV